jgi:hypothetical protein
VLVFFFSGRDPSKIEKSKDRTVTAIAEIGTCRQSTQRVEKGVCRMR